MLMAKSEAIEAIERLASYLGNKHHLEVSDLTQDSIVEYLANEGAKSVKTCVRAVAQRMHRARRTQQKLLKKLEHGKHYATQYITDYNARIQTVQERLDILKKFKERVADRTFYALQAEMKAQAETLEAELERDEPPVWEHIEPKRSPRVESSCWNGRVEMRVSLVPIGFGRVVTVVTVSGSLKNGTSETIEYKSVDGRHWTRCNVRYVATMVKRSCRNSVGVSVGYRQYSKQGTGRGRRVSFTHDVGGKRVNWNTTEYPASNATDAPHRFRRVIEKIRTGREETRSEWLRIGCDAELVAGLLR